MLPDPFLNEARMPETDIPDAPDASEAPDSAADDAPLVIGIYTAQRICRLWASYALPSRFIPPIYAELSDGTIAVATNLYDVAGEDTDDLRFAVSGVFCWGENKWLHVALSSFEPQLVFMH